MTWFKCPCLNCESAFVVGDYLLGNRTPHEAIMLMKEHLLYCHSFRDLEEWLERCLVYEMEKQKHENKM